MEFLERLYSNENFGIILFVIIAILVILFFVVLFFGKKDQKKSTTKPVMEEQKVSEPPKPETVVQPTIDAPVVPVIPNEEEQPLFKEVPTEVPLEVEQPKENVVLNENIEPKINNSVASEEVKESEPSVTEPALEKEFDFDALADQISKELESINVKKEEKEPEEIVPYFQEQKKEEVKPVIEEPKFEFPTFEPVKRDTIPDVMKKEQPSVMPSEKTPLPTVFSSVYVNRENEKKEKKEEFELPKKVELPKKAEEKVEPKENFSINSILNELEEESYNINHK